MIPQWKQDALIAVSREGLSLKDKWADDYDIVKTAIKNNPLSIRLAPRFQNNRELGKLAVSINGLAYFWLSDALQIDKEIIDLYRKNLPRIYKGPSPRCAKKRTVYYSSHLYCDALKALSTFNDIFDDLVEVRLQGNDCSKFLRDSHVTLLTGGTLIPHLIYGEYRPILTALMPNTAFSLLVDPVHKSVTDISLGRGFYGRNVIQAELISYEQKVPFKIGKACIEGGNAFTFILGTRHMLLVGEMSLCLTLIALENASYFKGKPYNAKSEPSAESYRLARNIKLFYSLKPNNYDVAPLGGEFGYRKLLMSPVSEEEKADLKDTANQIEARIHLTKEAMAHDAEVPLDNVIFLPQKYFHIDLDTFVTPSGEVVLHDDAMSISFLKHLLASPSLMTFEKLLLKDYLKTAEENEARYKDIMEARVKRLIEKKVPYRLLPASFVSTKFRSHLNYCNGVFVRRARLIKTLYSVTKLPGDGFIFLTTGPSFQAEMIVHNMFIRLFESIYPNYTLRGIQDMSQYISETNGGFRCLSFESVPAIEFK